MTAAEVIVISPGSPEYDSLKAKVVAGDRQAAQDFLMVCTWEGMSRRKDIPHAKRFRALKSLMASGAVEVKFIGR